MNISCEYVKIAVDGGDPVTQDEAVVYLKLPLPVDANELLFIDQLITSARLLVERKTGRKLMATQLELWLDRFSLGVPFFTGVRTGSSSEADSRTLELPYMPPKSVEAVKFFDDDDVETVYPATNYLVSMNDQDLKGRIILRDNATWPTDLREADAVRIQYTVGYGDAAAVPSVFKLAILKLVAAGYYNKGDCMDTCFASCGVQQILNPWIAFTG